MIKFIIRILIFLQIVEIKKPSAGYVIPKPHMRINLMRKRKSWCIHKRPFCRECQILTWLHSE